MKIKLIGYLPQELTDLGLKPGDIFNAVSSETGKGDSAQIRFIRDGQEFVATVERANYRKK